MVKLVEFSKLFFCPGVDDTRQLGEFLGQKLWPGAILLLDGALGAGKTALAKGLALGLGVDPAYDIVSPTFTLLNFYPGRLNFYHADLYRLSAPEVREIALLEQADDGVLAVEWPTQASELWPEDALCISIRVLPDEKREISLTGRVPVTQQLIMSLS